MSVYKTFRLTRRLYHAFQRKDFYAERAHDCGYWSLADLENACHYFGMDDVDECQDMLNHHFDKWEVKMNQDSDRSDDFDSGPGDDDDEEVDREGQEGFSKNKTGRRANRTLYAPKKR